MKGFGKREKRKGILNFEFRITNDDLLMEEIAA
jgi:hypothetical protein